MNSNSYSISLSDLNENKALSFNLNSSLEKTKNISKIGFFRVSTLLFLATFQLNSSNSFIELRPEIKQSEFHNVTLNESIGGINVSNYLNKDLYESEKKNLESQIDSIFQSTKKIEDNFVSKELLEEKIGSVSKDIENSKLSTRNWLLGGIITILLGFIGIIWYLITTYLGPIIEVLKKLESI